MHKSVYTDIEWDFYETQEEGALAQSIKEIAMQLRKTAPEALPKEAARWEGDPRLGVQKEVAAARKRYAAYEAELARLEALSSYERHWRAQGYAVIAGTDEAGRGPLAGPVVAAAVILPPDCRILGVNDSKQLSEKKREALFDEIQEKAVSFGIGIVSAQVIDEINILQATYEAMRKAIEALSVKPDLLLADAVTIPRLSLPQQAIIKGDAKSVSIAAASILAKVTRDRMMKEYDLLYPSYGFAQNKGYGAAAHVEALKTYGPCPIHRRSFLKNFGIE